MSSLTPQNQIGFGFGTSALVWSMYQTHMPNVASVRVSPALDPVLDSQRKVAGIEAALITLGVAFLTKSATVAIMGGMTMLAMDIAYRHADLVDNQTNKVVKPDVSSDLGSAPATN